MADEQPGMLNSIGRTARGSQTQSPLDDDPTQYDAGVQRNADAVADLTKWIQAGNPPDTWPKLAGGGTSEQFLTAMGLNYNPETHKLEPKGFWEVNWPVIAAVAGVVGLGAFEGIQAAASTAAAAGDDAAASVATGAATGAEAGGEVGATTGLDAATISSLPGATTADVPGLVYGGTASDVVGGLGPSAGGYTSGASKLGGLLKDIGKSVGAATTAAGNNALNQENLGLQANQQNILGGSAFVNQELGLANEEAQQRKDALKNVYQASMAANPRVSPFDPVGGPKLSPQYLQAIGALGNQGESMLSKPATYQVSGLPKPTPYTPINPKDVQGATGTKPGLLQKIGQWASPALSTAGKIASLFGY